MMSFYPNCSVVAMVGGEEAPLQIVVLLGNKNIWPIERTACRCIAVRKQNCFVAEKKEEIMYVFLGGA